MRTETAVKHPAARQHRPRGFTMPEMLGALLMLGTFFLIATQLFHTSVKLAHRSQLRASEIARLETAITALRTDVWSAQQMTVKDGNQLVLVQPGDKQVTWRIESNTLRRTSKGQTDTAPERRWQDVGTRLSFALDGPVLILRDNGAPPDSMNERRFLSQLRLAEATR
jgi:prepilin-type N-terminal cleavage/methylation domain-containing protein